MFSQHTSQSHTACTGLGKGPSPQERTQHARAGPAEATWLDATLL